MSFTMKIPATTANIGAGFDSIGIALNLQVTVKVPMADQLEIVLSSEQVNELPTDETNVSYQTAQRTRERYQADPLPPCRIEMKSQSPVARGLGSSSTPIVAGTELA